MTFPPLDSKGVNCLASNQTLAAPTPPNIMGIVVPESLSVFSGRLCCLESILKQKKKELESAFFFLECIHAKNLRLITELLFLLGFRESHWLSIEKMTCCLEMHLPQKGSH